MALGAGEARIFARIDVSRGKRGTTEGKREENIIQMYKQIPPVVSGVQRPVIFIC